MPLFHKYKIEDEIAKSLGLDETSINEEQLVGKAVARVPLLGYIKIWFVELIKLFTR